jgi:hypothetical protein
LLHESALNRRPKDEALHLCLTHNRGCLTAAYHSDATRPLMRGD